MPPVAGVPGPVADQRRGTDHRLDRAEACSSEGGRIRSSARPTTGKAAAADIPGFSVSSRGCVVVAPGEGFVVGPAGLDDAVEDPDPAVGELA